MQPAYLFAVISLAMTSSWAPPAVEHVPSAATVMSGANVGHASEAEQHASAEQDASQITGSIPAVLYRVSGEPLSCELIRLMDEVELITDDSYCG
jgi:hypothetical protein